MNCQPHDAKKIDLRSDKTTKRYIVFSNDLDHTKQKTSPFKARTLKLYYLCSENKGADQLCSYCTADLHLCFRIGKNLVLFVVFVSFYLFFSFTSALITAKKYIPLHLQWSGLNNKLFIFINKLRMCWEGKAWLILSRKITVLHE